MSGTQQAVVAPTAEVLPSADVAAGGAEPPPRRPAWRENARRLRAAAVTEPGRLRALGAVLVALLLAFGALTAWQAAERADSTHSVIHGSQPLSANAALIYRSLADANTTAAAGFLAGGEETPEVRERYEKRIGDAARQITKAAAAGERSPEARQRLAELNRRLSVYTGLVETARANNRQELPVGGAYLRHADRLMHEELLPAASALYAAESEQFRRDQRDAHAFPWAALALGVAAVLALLAAQRRHYLRTNRVFNRGLLAATTVAVLLLLWTAGGHLLARHHLDRAERDAARSLQTLNAALVSALQARGDEAMAMVTRGSRDNYEKTYQRQMRRLAGADPQAAEGGLLARAVEQAEDGKGRRLAGAARRDAATWHEQHATVRRLEGSGKYAEAVAMVIGPRDSTGETFDRIDAGLRQAINHEQRQFTAAAERAHRALAPLAAGAAALSLLGAAGAVLGIGRRLAEYR
ncbi:hypothetical protein [Streptomyces alkaliterrae]|uniref:hypothetical protein n=1 Tax=Streptomyces alkaliterrae TaxID=2213162 RepID=UPI002B20670E|nr:hypothetical protein [Streptomyces alkaliterrae]